MTLIPKVQASRGFSVFVSYAREDAAFKDELMLQLVGNGVEVHGDWELVAGADYAPRLQRMIESASAVVQIVSAASVASTNVRSEIELSHKLKKRLLPVVIEDGFDEAQMHPAARSAQWTFLREGDNIINGMASLLEALNTNPELMSTHTWLTERAAEWERQGRGAAGMLDRKELQIARDWLPRITRNEKEFPQVTPLQQEYITASERKRNLLLRVIAITAVLVALALAGLAWMWWDQRNEAQNQRNEAQARLASGEFKESSVAYEKDRAADLALALAAQAVQDASADDPRLKVYVQRAVHLASRGPLHVIPTERPLQDVVFCSGGKLAGVILDTGKIRMIDLTSGKRLSWEQPEDDARVLEGLHGSNLCFSPDGSEVAALQYQDSEKGQSSVFLQTRDARSGKIKLRKKAPKGIAPKGRPKPTNLRYSPDGKWIVADMLYDFNARMFVWNARNGESLSDPIDGPSLGGPMLYWDSPAPMSVHKELCCTATWSRAKNPGGSKIDVLQAQSGAALDSVEIEGEVSDMRFTSDGKHLAYITMRSEKDWRLGLWTLGSARPIETKVLPDSSFSQLPPDKDWIVTVVEKLEMGSMLFFWSVKDDTLQDRGMYITTGKLKSLSLTHDGKFSIAAHDGNRWWYQKWTPLEPVTNPNDRPIQAPFRMAGFLADPEGEAHFLPDQGVAWVGERGGSLRKFPLPNPDEHRFSKVVLAQSHRTFRAAFSHDCRSIALLATTKGRNASEEVSLLLCNATTGQPLWPAPVSASDSVLAFSQDGSRLLTGFRSTPGGSQGDNRSLESYRLIEVASGKAGPEFTPPFKLQAVAMSSNGSRIVGVAAQSNRVAQWDVRQDAIVQRPGFSSVNGVALMVLTKDGTHIATREDPLESEFRAFKIWQVDHMERPPVLLRFVDQSASVTGLGLLANPWAATTFDDNSARGVTLRQGSIYVQFTSVDDRLKYNFVPPPQKWLLNHDPPVFSDDGTRLIASISNSSSEAVVWESISGLRIASWQSERNQLVTHAFEPNGTALVALFEDGRINRYEMGAGKRQSWMEHMGPVISGLRRTENGMYERIGLEEMTGLRTEFLKALQESAKDGDDEDAARIWKRLGP